MFRDIDNIPPSADFRRHIDEVLDATDILLAIVGPRWLGPDPSQSRIANAADAVRFEIETAMRKNKPLIPVLVSHGDAKPRTVTDETSRNSSPSGVSTRKLS